MSYRRWMTALVAGVLALGLAVVPGYASNKPVTAPMTAHKAFNARAGMIDAADAYFKSNPAHIISADALFAIVQAKDAGYQIVDVRSAAHYALGHIDGAINIPFTTIADDASLAQLDSTKKIIVVCYTGETSSMTTVVWSMLGYDARALLYGMGGWVADKAIVGMDIQTGVAAGYPTVVRPTTTHRRYRAPKLGARYADVASAVKGQTKAYFAKGLAPVMTATQVQPIVQSKDRRYQIVSVRYAADYATGHIKGAMNLAWADVAKQMSKLDPRKTIVVYCYTGNMGAETAMFLNLMGYKAYNMMSGMSSWNSDATVGGFAGFNPAIVANYPTVK